MLPRVAVALISVLALAVPGFARDLTTDERASLDAALARFETASRANDKGAQLDMVPAGLMGFYKVNFPEFDEAGLRKMLLEQQPIVDDDTTPDYSLNDIHEDLASAPGELSDGTLYVILPMSTVVYQLDGQGGGDYEVRTQALIAVQEAGAWKMLVMTAPRELGLHAQIIPAAEGDDAFFAAIAAAETAVQ